MSASHLSLSPAESVFVDNLIALGDPEAAAAASGVQPSLALDPRVQSAIVERIREHGPSDAAYARRVLRDLASQAENEGIRFRAASTLWERGLGKVPDTIQVDVSIQHVSRQALHAEIRSLISELGIPEDAEFEEVAQIPDAREEVVPPAGLPEHDKTGASVAQQVERPLDAPGGEVAGSSPAAGAYIPALPNKWR